jgi:hypothetical protein
MLHDVRHRGFHIGIATLIAIACCGCLLSGSTKKATMNQNTALPTDRQTSKLVPILGKNNSDCPASVSLIKMGPSKPPLVFHQLNVRLINRQRDVNWFVLRYRDPLESTGKFGCYKEEKNCFSAEQSWEEGKTQGAAVVVIHFLGLEPFTALRVPAGADITLGNYIINTAEPVSDFEIWEVESLLVNGKTPLEKWLPYPVLSDRLVHIGERSKTAVLDWDKTNNNYRQDYPNEKVEFVIANAIRKWLVPVSPAKK